MEKGATAGSAQGISLAPQEDAGGPDQERALAIRSQPDRLAGLIPVHLTTAILATVVSLGVSVGWAFLQEKLSGRRSVPGQKPLFDRTTGYGVDQVIQYWSGLDADGLRAEKRFLIWDLFYPFIYGSALIVQLWTLGQVLGISIDWFVVPVAPLIVADWTENLFQLNQLERFVKRTALSPERIRVASIGTIVKLWLLRLFIALVAGGWIVVGVRALR
jgi:hypothetical protein